MIPFLIGLAFVALLVGAAILRLQRSPSAQAFNLRQIMGALENLQRRPPGAYLIIEDPRDRKTVQVSGSISEPMFLNLPCQDLNRDEYDRANRLFEKYGHHGPETFPTFESWNGRALGEQTSFMLNCGDDLARAARFILEVFLNVYLVAPHLRLNILER